MIKVGIVGGTGYTGAELLRILLQHPEVEIQAITSRKEAGIAVDELFPGLRGVVKLKFSDPTKTKLKECNTVFFATPNGVAMQQAKELLDDGVRIIDLAADFRIKDVSADDCGRTPSFERGGIVARTGPLGEGQSPVGNVRHGSTQ